MKYLIVVVVTALIFLVAGCALGFKVGSEKIWANASVYYASPAISALEEKSYGYFVDLSPESCKKQYSRQISTAVNAYARYLSRWESKLDLDIIWDPSTESISGKLIKYYVSKSEVNYTEISETEYWNDLQSRNISFYEKVQVSDPDLYSQFELEADNDLRNLKNAIKHHQLIDE